MVPLFITLPCDCLERQPDSAKQGPALRHQRPAPPAGLTGKPRTSTAWAVRQLCPGCTVASLCFFMLAQNQCWACLSDPVKEFEMIFYGITGVSWLEADFMVPSTAEGLLHSSRCMPSQMQCFHWSLNCGAMGKKPLPGVRKWRWRKGRWTRGSRHPLLLRRVWDLGRNSTGDALGWITLRALPMLWFYPFMSFMKIEGRKEGMNLRGTKEVMVRVYKGFCVSDLSAWRA